MRAKTTQPNPSPSSSTQQYERKSSRTRSPGGRIPSGKMARLPSKDYLKGTCTTPFCEKWHPPECLFYNSEMEADLEGSALMHTVRLMKSLAKGSKIMERQLGCVFKDMQPPKSSSIVEGLKHTETNPMCSIHKSRRTSC